MESNRDQAVDEADEQARPGNEADFVALLQRHGGIVRKVAYSYAWNPADRHDLMQEITLQLWRAWPRYTAGRPFSTWMYRIALNVAISAVRQATRRPTVPLDEAALELADPASEPLAADDNAAVLRRLIAALEPLDRALLLLYLDERKYPDIAAILGLSETNVATKLSRLKQRMRRELALNREGE